MSVLHLNENSFDSAIGSGLVMVDFWAGWCMPCKMVAPVIEELAAELEGKVTVAKVDIDKEAGLASRFGVMSIPTIIVFKDGVEMKRIVGVQPKEKFEAALQIS